MTQPIIMGLDLATNAGWAVHDRSKHRSSIECGVISLENYEWESKYGSFAVQFLELVRRTKPDYAAIESPEHAVRGFKKKRDAGAEDEYRGFLRNFVKLLSNAVNQYGATSPQVERVLEMVNNNTMNSGALQLSGVVGSAVSVLTLLNVPCGFISARSWHSQYYGKGFKPPMKMVRSKTTGQLREDGLDWKQAAIDAAEREGITLPKTKKDQRDAAEAVAVATCWESTKVIEFEWMQKRFMALRTGAFRKEAA